MEAKEIKLIPYLNFNGNCEEALNFYSGILNGTVEIQSRYDNPAMHAPDEYKDKILHGRLHFPGGVIYASDVLPGKEAHKSSGDVALSLDFPDTKTAERAFHMLAAHGQVHIPFKKQFWGDWHGNLTDHFGIRWMLNCTGA
ncbi:VOC family protein [Chitinophaga sp. MM2321]|uniref:VOC family protein n=1 Tax=Chitinophaga sp. MM2321 TaxID=3137178 RepID=UPI0032D58DF5